MENKKILLPVLLFSGTLTLGLPLSWSQGMKGETGGSPGKEGQAPQKKERTESPMGAKKEGARESKAGSEDVKQAQQALKEKGHDPGPVDGILGPKTQAALKAFQEANKVKASGKLDAETKDKLGLSGGGRMGKESGARGTKEKSSKQDMK